MADPHFTEIFTCPVAPGRLWLWSRACPTKLPHDLEQGQRLARWFGPPYNAWYVGKIDQVNRRRTKSENVSVAFNDETYGETVGMFIADADSYGADKMWVLLEGIPINLDDGDD